MSRFIDRLIDRAYPSPSLVRPLLPSRYEPEVDAARLRDRWAPDQPADDPIEITATPDHASTPRPTGSPSAAKPGPARPESHIAGHVDDGGARRVAGRPPDRLALDAGSWRDAPPLPRQAQTAAEAHSALSVYGRERIFEPSAAVDTPAPPRPARAETERYVQETTGLFTAATPEDDAPARHDTAPSPRSDIGAQIERVHRAAESSARSDTTEVTITIGRIEVRSAPAEPRRRPAGRARVSLDEFLARGERRR